jgi:isoleucyl-tRNA synthetase
MAPFTPFITEEIYLKMKKDEKESVHLCDYPEAKDSLIDEDLESAMQEARDIVNLSLAERQKAGIKVRQALKSITVKGFKTSLKCRPEIIDLIKDEVNVKEVILNTSISNEVELDTNITPELKEEGEVREIIRQIQQIRKDMKLVPEDTINVLYQKSEFFDKILIKNKDNILKEVLAKDFVVSSEELKEIEIDGGKVFLGVKKI